MLVLLIIAAEFTLTDQLVNQIAEHDSGSVFRPKLMQKTVAPQQKKTPEGPKANQREAQRETAREAILTAAGILFAEHGYNNVSLDKIAKSAGYTKGNLLHYFSSKQNLQAEVIDRYVGIGSRATRRDDEPPMNLAAIEELAQNTFHFFRKHPEYSRLTTWALLEPEHEIPQGTSQLVQAFTQEFSRAQKAGSVRDDVLPQHAHAAMYNMTFAWFLTRRFFLKAWADSEKSSTADDSANADLGSNNEGDEAYLKDMLKIIQRGLAAE